MLLVVGDARGQCGFRFEHIEELERVLDETSAFELYLTDPQSSYVVAFNHHDMLIGTGDATAWVRSLALTGV